MAQALLPIFFENMGSIILVWLFVVRLLYCWCSTCISAIFDYLVGSFVNRMSHLLNEQIGIFVILAYLVEVLSWFDFDIQSSVSDIIDDRIVTLTVYQAKLNHANYE